MKNEADFKRVFKKSVQKHKGYCISLAAPMISGLPDLYCIMPGYVPVLLEAKYIGNVGDTFRRKIDYRPLQRFWLDGCNSVYQYAAWGLIGFYHKDMYYCCLVHPKHTHVDSLLNKPDMFYTCNISSKEFNVNELFTKSCIGKIQVNVNELEPEHKEDFSLDFREELDKILA